MYGLTIYRMLVKGKIRVVRILIVQQASGQAIECLCFQALRISASTCASEGATLKEGGPALERDQRGVLRRLKSKSTFQETFKECSGQCL